MQLWEQSQADQMTAQPSSYEIRPDVCRLLNDQNSTDMR